MREDSVDIGSPIAVDDWWRCLVLLHEAYGGSSCGAGVRLEGYYHVFALACRALGTPRWPGDRGPKWNVAIARDFIARVAGGKAIVGGPLDGRTDDHAAGGEPP